MHYPDLSALIADRKRALSKGPIALVLIEDAVEVESTLAHLQARGFAQIIAFAAPDMILPAQVDRVDYEVLTDMALLDVVNGVISAAPGQWIHYCFNGEYLFYPFCEDRSVGELTAFCAEERRDTVLTYVVDLYTTNTTALPDGVDKGAACLDTSGYYALARKDPSGAFLDRQLEFFGGLRWRFEEHVPTHRRRIDRMSLFRAVPDLRMGPDRRFNLAEHNTYACPWHNSPTAAVCSFRTAKALLRNPGSRDQIDGLGWQYTAGFNWQSQQLCDLGLMEPGQWF